MRVDGPKGPKVLRVLKFDSGFAAEGCGGGIGHASGVKVQRVHKVQRVQRGWYRRFAAMSFVIPLRGMENRTTGLCTLEMHPYPHLRRYFPRRGKF